MRVNRAGNDLHDSIMNASLGHRRVFSTTDTYQWKWRNAMSFCIGGVEYHRTTEAARHIGISRSTLLRWLDQGRIDIPVRRDRNGWRVFTLEELDVLKAAADRIDEPAS